MRLNIRSAKVQECEELSIIFKEVLERLPYYNVVAKQSELDKYSLSELAKKIEQDPDSVLIAEENNEIVGFCLNRLDDMLIWLEWFGVVEHKRRNGIARKLVNHLESIAPHRNAHKIWCDCRTENIKSISLLSSIGYMQICTVKNHWYGQDFILWQKEIEKTIL